MTLTERIDAMAQLGNHLRTAKDEYLDAIIARTEFNNGWLTKANQKQAIQAIATHFLTKEALEAWANRYAIREDGKQQTVGLILAGNIPLVGFHDVLCVFISGHRAMVKFSEKDRFLLPYLFKLLKEIHPVTESYFQIVEHLKGFDAVIATGSNNSARYFDAYFGKYPNIIRRNRNGVAVLNGTESRAELIDLGKDVFQYFGLGCRNVSKLYVPKGYNFDLLLEALHEYREIVLHSKYKNNFDYHYALFIINRAKYLANGCILMREDDAIVSPIANLYYSFYDNEQELVSLLNERAIEIQLVVSKSALKDLQVPNFRFGEAQQPKLDDYADGVDTMAFLSSL
ncbi:MAG: acyl-CoA reductase [Bacteroidota bacterium]